MLLPNMGQSQPRKLVKCMITIMPVAKIKANQQFVPGGDIRKAENQWLVRALQDAQLERCPREASVRHIVAYLSRLHSFCPSPTAQLYIRAADMYTYTFTDLNLYIPRPAWYGYQELGCRPGPTDLQLCLVVVCRLTMLLLLDL